MKPLVFASLPVSTMQEQRFQKFAAWMGVPTKTVVIDDKADPARQLLSESSAKFCLAISVDTLTAMLKASPQPAHLRRFIEEQCTALLVFGCCDKVRHGSTLAWLTNGAVRGVAVREDKSDKENEFKLPRGGQAFSRQLAGLDFAVGRSEAQPVFELDADASAPETIMMAKHGPVFICINIASCRLFAIAGLEAPDIDEPFCRDRGIEEHYHQIIPFLVFLRHGFELNCWHGVESTARLIIDDPLLTDKYGFLDYRTLSSSMLRNRYGTSIAFIPWNYRRTSREWAGSFLDKAMNLSICVHGCDHTNREFEAMDSEVLEHKAGLALARMEQHLERTQLPFEPVMVFPQGRFSARAMLALRANGYLAAVNTSCFPTDDGPDVLKMADFLRPAVTRFYGFPIFQRRYPKHLIGSAFDMFLGKPALIVEHHQYLADGCKKLEEFVGELHRCEPGLSWPTLSSQLTRSCMMRRLSDDSFNVRFFTSRFQFKNAQASKCRFLLEKDEPDVSIIRKVLVDGESVTYKSSESVIQLEVEAGAGDRKVIEILDHPRRSMPAKRSGVTYSFGVFVRRGLSEFRDNALSRHPVLLRAAKGVARGLRVTGDRERKGEG